MAPMLAPHWVPQWRSHRESTHPRTRLSCVGQVTVQGEDSSANPSFSSPSSQEHRGTSKEGFPGRSLHWRRMPRLSERRMLRASRRGGCWSGRRMLGMLVGTGAPAQLPSRQSKLQPLAQATQRLQQTVVPCWILLQSTEGSLTGTGSSVSDRTTSLHSSPGPGSPPNIHHNTPWHPATKILCQDPNPLGGGGHHIPALQE